MFFKKKREIKTYDKENLRPVIKASICNGEQVAGFQDIHTVKYREMSVTDDAAVAKLIRDNLKKYKLDIPGTVYFDEGLDHLSDYYGADERKYFVIEDAHGKVIGGIGFAKLDWMEDTAELQKLYLDDSAKGSGLGYELIKIIEDRMLASGYKYSYLETHDNLQAAIHIYEKSGYTEIARPKEVVHSAMNRFFKKNLKQLRVETRTWGIWEVCKWF